MEIGVLDATKENNIGIITTSPQAVPICESSGTSLTPLQDQKQNELWEEDSLDLNLENNDCGYNSLTETLGSVVDT